MRKLITVSILTVGLLASAVPAQAAYPVPFTPVETVVEAGLNNGFVVAPPSKAIPKNAAAPVITGRLSPKPKAVSIGTVNLKQPVAPLLTGLPKKADVVIRLIANDHYLILGSATTTAKGRLQLPVVRFTEAGTYFFVVTFGSGNSVKLKVVVD